MLGGDAVGFGHHFIDGVAKDDFAIVLPGLARDGGGGKPAQKFFNGGGGFGGEFGGGSQQDGGAAGTMLGLSDQIDGGHFWVAGIVGDDQGFGGTGKEIDADTAE